MKKELLIRYLEKHYPPSSAEEWDNVGLQVGDDEGEVKHVFLALDLTEAVLEQAVAAGADMILTHHPMIFGGLKKVNNKTFTGRKVLSLIRHNITYYAMHTNYDIFGMAPISAARLGLTNCAPLSPAPGEEEEGIGRVGDLSDKISLKECALLVKKAFGIEEVKVYGDPSKEIQKVAVCTGSGKSLLREAGKAGAEVYVTGDIDHHTGIDAVADGICIIDAGHYGTEYMFMEEMKAELSEAFPELIISTAGFVNPYTVF